MHFVADLWPGICTRPWVYSRHHRREIELNRAQLGQVVDTLRWLGNFKVGHLHVRRLLLETESANCKCCLKHCSSVSMCVSTTWRRIYESTFLKKERPREAYCLCWPDVDTDTTSYFIPVDAIKSHWALCEEAVVQMSLMKSLLGNVWTLSKTMPTHSLLPTNL